MNFATSTFRAVLLFHLISLILAIACAQPSSITSSDTIKSTESAIVDLSALLTQPSQQQFSMSTQSTLTSSDASATADLPKLTTSSSIVRARRSADRGHADHGWLDSFHTFSFADYYDSDFEGFGCLRVINEDRVQANRGFGRHPHRDFEIFSYIVQGALKHDDSLGHSETLIRGQVQFTSAGTGIAHSEMNGSSKELVHFLQIWVKPRSNGLKPSYSTATFSDADKSGKWALIVSPEEDANADGSITVHADCRMYATLLRHDERREFVARPNTKLYVHVVSDIAGMHGLKQETAIKLNDRDDHLLQSGDGAFVTFSNKGQANAIVLTGVNAKDQQGNPAEVLLFEVKV